MTGGTQSVGGKTLTKMAGRNRGIMPVHHIHHNRGASPTSGYREATAPVELESILVMQHYITAQCIFAALNHDLVILLDLAFQQGIPSLHSANEISNATYLIIEPVMNDSIVYVHIIVFSMLLYIPYAFLPAFISCWCTYLKLESNSNTLDR